MKKSFLSTMTILATAASLLIISGSPVHAQSLNHSAWSRGQAEAASLPLRERLQLRTARQAALKANPALARAIARGTASHKELVKAMLQADPSIAPIIAKLKKKTLSI